MVRLVVSRGTRLLLNVTRDKASSSYTIQGRLMNKTLGVPDRTIKVRINETDYTVTTNNTGYFKITPSLLPKDNKPTLYMISASFEGDSPLNATAWAYMLDGTKFPACTTTQFGYKSSTNSVSLTVEPPATQAATSSPDATTKETSQLNTVNIPPPKTPEQLEQEAKNSGALTIWHEFSWWYPWYRLHLKFSMNGAIIHIGFNPILPGGEIFDPPKNLGNIVDPVNLESAVPIEELAHIVQLMLEASIIDILVTAVSVLYLGSTRFPLAAWAAIGLYITVILTLGYIAVQNLYNAGLKNSGRAFMAGIFMGLFSVALGSCLGALDAPKTTKLLISALSAILGTLFGNLYDTRPMMDLLEVLIITAISAIAFTGLSFRIPEPMGNVFFIGFLVITLIGMIASGSILLSVMV